MSALKCNGGELDLQQCEFSAPDEICQEHAHDSIVYCGTSGDGTQEGAGRLLSFDGSPSIDGIGRFEVFHGNAWSPVCKSGFTAGAANVACKSMGFAGAQATPGFVSCGNVDGKNYCGESPPQLSEIACSGQEADVLACPHDETDSVFCAPAESVVLQCAGSGDTQGRANK